MIYFFQINNFSPNEKNGKFLLNVCLSLIFGVVVELRLKTTTITIELYRTVYKVRWWHVLARSY